MPEGCTHIGSRVTGGGVFPHRTHFKCDTCGATWTRGSGGDIAKPCTCGPDEACGDPCDYESRCKGCGHPKHSGFCRELEMPGSPGDVDECGCLDDREPPLTPEEEEEASKDEEGLSGPCDCGEGAVHYTAADCPAEERRRAAEPPPQPERRPPYAVAYSVQGHLFEVALPGDATVRAVDGALVIQHHLGPVAGIVSVLPVINKESD